jgi:hypothetical protein
MIAAWGAASSLQRMRHHRLLETSLQQVAEVMGAAL